MPGLRLWSAAKWVQAQVSFSLPLVETGTGGMNQRSVYDASRYEPYQKRERY